jgi:2,3-bisphosphoglycerate-independent phosphoglycerate mutase
MDVLIKRKTDCLLGHAVNRKRKHMGLYPHHHLWFRQTLQTKSKQLDTQKVTIQKSDI